MKSRVNQLERLLKEVKAALEFSKSGQLFMPLQEHQNERCLIVGDFVIVDMQEYLNDPPPQKPGPTQGTPAA